MSNRTLPLLLTLLLLAGSLPARAQYPGAQQPNQEAFAPIDLPTPNQYRSASGRPGPAYWQQRADYRIRVTLDAARHRVTGSETITYTNNSPDELGFLWLQIEQNRFDAESRGSVINSGGRWRGGFEEGGMKIDRVQLVRDGRRTPARFRVDDTRMRVELEEPLPPGGAALQLEIDWSFVVPEYGADRMGRLEVEDGWVYEIAQWYPRMYVYDDVNGWNPMPYLGQGEFYTEFGTFDVEITAPRDVVVVATGVLTNPGEVWTAEQRARLERARTSAETVRIIEPDEVGRAASRPAGSGPLTWKFHAEQVRDFAWAASRAFILDGAGWEDVLILSAYPKEGLRRAEDPGPGWEEATKFGRHAISHYSKTWFRYPYPVAISVGGIVGGMEYPMIQFSSVFARDQGLMGVVDHELGHNWFPMIVQNDERRYAWMDEGFNTFINHYSNLDFYGEDAARAARTGSRAIAAQMSSPMADQPIATYPDLVRPSGLGFLAYSKPGKGLVILRDFVLGPEVFDRAFRAYAERWAFKHPQPADFFRTVEDVSGEDLDWFWRGWFFSTDVLDQAVDSVTVEDGVTHVHLSNQEGLVMPVELEIGFADGAVERRRLPVEAWLRGNTFTYRLEDRRAVARVTVDPDGQLPDVDLQDNQWEAARINIQGPVR